MPQNKVEQRLLKARTWTLVGVSLLAVFIVGLLIYGYASQHDPEKVKKQLYACGKFGDQQLLIDKRYLYWGMVNYQDVNYWGKM